MSLVLVLFTLTLASVTTLGGTAGKSNRKPADAVRDKAATANSKAESNEAKPEKTILFVGDSLASGYGVKKEESFPERVGEMLREKGHKIKIVNGSIPGSVTAEADRRVRWYLKVKPDVVVLELGGNDGLKGTPVSVIKSNLAKAIDLAKSNDIKVLLAGMRVYTNLGSDYAKDFERVYSELAREKGVPFVPFLLEGVAMDRTLNQSDLKHPNAKGHEIIARDLTRALEKLL